jgi:hypothetical protein
MIKIPEYVYRLGIGRNVTLPSGYLITKNRENFWLQNPNNSGGIVITLKRNGYSYFPTKGDAERTIGLTFFPITEYEIGDGNEKT